jgi:hypothetical protein
MEARDRELTGEGKREALVGEVGHLSQHQALRRLLECETAAALPFNRRRRCTMHPREHTQQQRAQVSALQRREGGSGCVGRGGDGVGALGEEGMESGCVGRSGGQARSDWGGARSEARAEETLPWEFGRP